MTALFDSTTAAPLDVLGPTIQILARAGYDDGPSVMRGVIPPGVAVSLHAHPDPETFLALSGTVDGLADGRRPSWPPSRPYRSTSAAIRANAAAGAARAASRRSPDYETRGQGEGLTDS